MTTDISALLTRLADPATRPDPYDTLRVLRERSPVLDPVSGLVVVARRADCEAVLRSPGVSSDRRGAGITVVPQQPNLINLDAPDHTRLRRLAGRAFKPRVIERWRPRVEAIARELLTGIAEGGGTADIASRFAYPMPVRVICEMLGVPRRDHPVFERWAHAIAYTVDPRLVPGRLDAETIADVEEAREGFAGYFSELIDARAKDPREDILSELIAAGEDEDRLTRTELVIMCILLLVAGHETTANLILNGVLALLRHPDQLGLLRDDPALAGAAVEEVLRYDAPAQMVTRIAGGPLTVGGMEIAAGSPILLLLAAANRDPDVHEAPDVFDITRGDGGHLGFAAGAHFCLGSVLARLEATIALSAFATAFADPVLVRESLRYRPHIAVRGPDRLQVSFSGISPEALEALGATERVHG
ncbi:cytochrome P450 [Actinomadura graeca]|uniref:Cytochrome P450 n=1 Tax=Actinomadura graeca TaxID=2750812 RepID=A0ABX8QYH8_9ACTN|nr:cytochrome P450 [Actinomadura graeca]QXJ23396.1 cytochrome P450 [Actinomadura graeca]